MLDVLRLLARSVMQGNVFEQLGHLLNMQKGRAVDMSCALFGGRAQPRPRGRVIPGKPDHTDSVSGNTLLTCTVAGSGKEDVCFRAGRAFSPPIRNESFDMTQEAGFRFRESLQKHGSFV